MDADLVKLVDKVQGDSQAQTVIDGKVVALPSGRTLHSLKGLVDQFRQRPELRAGNTTLTDLASFIAWTKRHQDADSVVFAQDDMTEPALVAVIDHDLAGLEEAEKRARFGRHRGNYAFPMSREWQTWLKAGTTPMGAVEFAAFFEERIGDVMPPPYEIDGTTGAETFTAQDPEIRKLVLTLGKKFATVPEIVRLTRGVEINVDARAVSKIDRDTGEHFVEFSEANGEGMERVKPPNAFLIAIPVLANGPATLIAVHLRYRANGGKVTWSVAMHQPERVFEHVFAAALEEVEESTGLKPLRGLAPAAR